jgi:chromosome segregation ATPase
MQYGEKATTLNQELDETKSHIIRLQTSLDHDSTQVEPLESRIKDLEKACSQIRSQLQTITTQIGQLLPEHEVTDFDRLRRQEGDIIRRSQSTLTDLSELRAREREAIASKKELADACQLTAQHVQRLSALNREKEDLSQLKEALIALQGRLQREAQELLAKGIVDVLRNLNITYNGIVTENGDTYLLIKDRKNRDLAKVRFQELSESEIINLVVSLAVKGDVWSRTNNKELKLFILDDARALDGEAKKSLGETLRQAMNHQPQLAFFEPES